MQYQVTNLRSAMCEVCMVQGCSTIGTSYNQFVMMRQHTWYCSMWFMRRKGILLGLLPRVRKIVAAGAGYIVVIGSVGCRCHS